MKRTCGGILALGVAAGVCGMIVGGCGGAKEEEVWEPLDVQKLRAVHELRAVQEPQEEQEVEEELMVTIKTSMGDIRAELWDDKAPVTVSNFLAYADEGHFDGLIFHRVINGFMIQGGGFSPDMRQKDTRASIVNEARADTPNARGTLAMARTSDINSATSQFFINLVDNAPLNHRDESSRGFGYCVFGKVVEGMDVVDKIAKVKTGSMGPFQDVPVEPIVIENMRREGGQAEPNE